MNKLGKGVRRVDPTLRRREGRKRGVAMRRKVASKSKQTKKKWTPVIDPDLSSSESSSSSDAEGEQPEHDQDASSSNEEEDEEEESESEDDDESESEEASEESSDGEADESEGESSSDDETNPMSRRRLHQKVTATTTQLLPFKARGRLRTLLRFPPNCRRHASYRRSNRPSEFQNRRRPRMIPQPVMTTTTRQETNNLPRRKQMRSRSLSYLDLG
jgi:hypothetical protein